MHYYRRLISCLPFFLILFLACGQEAPAPAQSSATAPPTPPQPDRTVLVDSAGMTILERIAPPAGYLRTEVAPGSFGQYLRTLPLKPADAEVQYYDGSSKPNRGVYAAVIDLPIGRRDLHQCADAVMRLRAEYLWAQQRYADIHFNFTSGFRVDYTEWMQGKRIRVDGNQVRWVSRQAPSNTYADFWRYLEIIFAYAGTASLEKELLPVPIEQAQIGDVLIQGGYPGHAVLIVDQATHSTTGQQLFLLAQSYMPAQELQLLQNPASDTKNPWYTLESGTIRTPEWTFSSANLKRFAE